MTDAQIADRIAIGIFLLSLISFHTPYSAWCDFGNLHEQIREFLKDIVNEIDRLTPEFGVFPAENRNSKVWCGTASIANQKTALNAPLSGLPCLAWQIGFGYPLSDDLIVLRSTSEQGSIPFLLENQTIINIKKDRFVFSAAGHLERREFRTDSTPPDIQKSATHSMRFHYLDDKLKKHGRFYEWILPLDAHCVIVGNPREDEPDYRSEDITELTDALILVAPKDDDPAVLDRFRRIRVAALLEIQRLDRESKLTGYLALVGGIISVSCLWAFVTNVDFTSKIHF